MVSRLYEIAIIIHEKFAIRAFPPDGSMHVSDQPPAGERADRVKAGI
jgi:hypothetical protein